MIASRFGHAAAALCAALAMVVVAGCQDSSSVSSSAPSDSTETSVPKADSSNSSTTTVAPDAAPQVQTDRCAPSVAESEVVVWHALGNDSETKLVELTDRFNALESGVTVRLEKTGNYVETLALLASTSPDDRPDAILSDVKGLRSLYDSGLVITPAECPGASSFDDLLPVVSASYSIEGVLQGFPFSVSVPVLVFDAALFREAGLDPTVPPRTLDELGTTAQQIVDSGAAPHGFVAWDGYGPWFVTQYNSRVGEVSGVPDNGRAGVAVAEVDFATERIVESYEWLRDRVDDGSALWIGGNPSGVDDLARLVDRAGGAAMTISTSASIGDLSRLLATGAFDDPVTGARPELASAPMPGPGEGSLVGGGGFLLLDTDDPGAASGAASFLSWLTDPVQHAEFAGFTGFSPIRRSEIEQVVLQQAWSETPPLRVSFDVLADLPADAVRAGPAWGAGVDIDRILYETLTLVIEGADARTSLERASEQTNELLRVYNASVAE
jgi:sn-glycerol 3-phosphate transport system substrate-binding protein